MALLRNMVTAVSEVLERQRAILMVVAGCQPTSGRQQLAIHATKWLEAAIAAVGMLHTIVGAGNTYRPAWC